MNSEKKLMAEAAVLYYEKKLTQQEIARIMGVTRQTVSKLLNDAISEQVVEIRIHHPQSDCSELAQAISRHFGIQQAVVASVSGRDEALCRLMTVKTAAEYLRPQLERGKKKIALSWGRTLQALIAELPPIQAAHSTVFPLFGATDSVTPCFLSNELARNFSDRIGAEVKYAWFPYRPDTAEDAALFKRTSYYQKMQTLWDHIDIAIVGIGNTTVLQLFEDTFGYRERSANAAGDIATHLFTAEGRIIEPYHHALCASADNLRQAENTVGIACSNTKNDKVDSIIGALHTGLLNTLITDEHTARAILAKAGFDRQAL